jgi:hypothetical protein
MFLPYESSVPDMGTPKSRPLGEIGQHEKAGPHQLLLPGSAKRHIAIESNQHIFYTFLWYGCHTQNDQLLHRQLRSIFRLHGALVEPLGL